MNQRSQSASTPNFSTQSARSGRSPIAPSFFSSPSIRTLSIPAMDQASRQGPQLQPAYTVGKGAIPAPDLIARCSLGTLLHRAATFAVGASVFIHRAAGKASIINQIDNAEAVDVDRRGRSAVAFDNELLAKSPQGTSAIFRPTSARSSSRVPPPIAISASPLERSNARCFMINSTVMPGCPE
jgi:hypothetical protein